MGAWPCHAAECRGVRFSLSQALTEAVPSVSSKATISTCPCQALTCSAVRPCATHHHTMLTLECGKRVVVAVVVVSVTYLGVLALDGGPRVLQKEPRHGEPILQGEQVEGAATIRVLDIDVGIVGQQNFDRVVVALQPACRNNAFISVCRHQQPSQQCAKLTFTCTVYYNAIISKANNYVANRRAVLPSWARWSMGAECFFSRQSTRPAWPSCAASIRGLLPSLSVSSIFAPTSSNRSHTSEWPSNCHKTRQLRSI